MRAFLKLERLLCINCIYNLVLVWNSLYNENLRDMRLTQLQTTFQQYLVHTKCNAAYALIIIAKRVKLCPCCLG